MRIAYLRQSYVPQGPGEGGPLMVRSHAQEMFQGVGVFLWTVMSNVSWVMIIWGPLMARLTVRHT